MEVSMKTLLNRGLYLKYSHHIGNKARKWIWTIIRTGLVLGISYIILYPIFIKLSVAFMETRDLHDLTVKYIPRHFTMENIDYVIKNMNYWSSLFSTIKLSVLTTVLQVAACTLAAYGYARFNFKGKKILFAIVIFTLVVPPQTLMVPSYIRFRFFDVFGIIELITGQKGVNLLNTVWPFVITAATAMGLRNGLFIYVMRQFFRGMPKELEEAARVDGAGVFKTFYRIMLPGAIPALIMIILFSFVWQWNDTFYTLFFMPDADTLTENLMNLPWTIDVWVTSTAVGAGYYGASPEIRSQLLNTGSLLVICPLIIMYLFAQKYFVESIERSGLVE